MSLLTVLYMNFDPLPLESRVMGYTHKASISASLLTDTTNGDAQIFTAAILPNTRISDVLMDLKIPFANTADPTNNHTVVEVGDGETANQFLSNTEINAIGVQTFADGVTNSTTTLTSATAGFTAADAGNAISGAGIPAGTTIATVNSATNVTLSAAATATATGVTINIAGRGTVPYVASTSGGKVYLAADTLRIAFTPKSGTALTALNQGQLDIYVKMQSDAEGLG